MKTNIPGCMPIEAVGDEAVGGKAAGLVDLIHRGLPVPAAFVIFNAQSQRYPDELQAYYDMLGGGKVAVRPISA